MIFQCPSSVEEWNEIGKNFGLRWNCLDCYGAIDGKHIVIKAPVNLQIYQQITKYYFYQCEYFFVISDIVYTLDSVVISL